MSDTRTQAMTVLGATGRLAMGTARFFFLALGAGVFLMVLIVAWWISGWVPTVTRGKPAMNWPVEPLASVKAAPITATHPTRGREEGLLFGGAATGQAFAAIILAERNDSAFPFTMTTPVFWQFDALRVLAPRVGGPTYDMTTRWGRFTGRDLFYRELDGRTRTCIVFRNAFETADFALGGFYCAPGAQTADAGPLACMIDRLQFPPSERKSSALTYFAARANVAPTCASSTFYEPGTRRVVRDRNGGVIRLEERSGGSYPLWR